MNYAERLEKVAVLGAAGKMGSGIVLLTAMEMADLSLEPGNQSRDFALHAIDISEPALSGLLKYLRGQVRRAAEKKAVGLRDAYAGRADLVENEEMIGQYVEDVLAVVRPTTRLEAAYGASLVFEAASEDPDLKVRLLGRIRAQNQKDAWFLTNTSSIPIHELDEKAGLGRTDHRLPLLQPAGRPEARRGHPGEIHSARAGRFRRPIRQKAAQDRRAFERRRRFHRQRPFHEGRPPRYRRGRAAGRGVRLRRRRLYGQQGQPGFPHPAHGHLPARRLRRARHLPVHPQGHERPVRRPRLAEPSPRPVGRVWGSTAGSSPTAPRRTAS